MEIKLKFKETETGFSSKVSAVNFVDERKDVIVFPDFLPERGKVYLCYVEKLENEGGEKATYVKEIEETFHVDMFLGGMGDSYDRGKVRVVSDFFPIEEKVVEATREKFEMDGGIIKVTLSYNGIIEITYPTADESLFSEAPEWMIRKYYNGGE